MPCRSSAPNLQAARRPCADREEKRGTRGSAHPARKQEQLNLDGRKQEQLDLDGPNQRGLSEVLDWRLHDLRRRWFPAWLALGWHRISPTRSSTMPRERSRALLRFISDTS